MKCLHFKSIIRCYCEYIFKRGITKEKEGDSDTEKRGERDREIERERKGEREKERENFTNYKIAILLSMVCYAYINFV